MRIALFSDNFYPEIGGIQDSVLTTGRALAKLGHSVAFFVPSFSARDCRIAELPPHELEMSSGMEIHRFASIHVPSPTLQSRLVWPTGLRWRTVRDFRPDILHTHGFFGIGLEALVAARTLQIPLVGTNHWALSGFRQYAPFKSEWFIRRAIGYASWYFNHCRFVTAPSLSAIREMEERGFHSRHTVLSNPIDTSAFSPISTEARRELKQRLGLTDATVVYAGRLAREKNIAVLIRAVARLREAMPRITLAIAGHGSARTELERLSDSLGIQGNIRFFGTLEQHALADLLRASDVFAIASTSETQSMTLLQAMACGVPAVGVRALALPEYIEDGRTGTIVPPGDDAAMAEAIRTLLTDTPKRTVFAERSEEKVSRHYGVRAVVQTLEELYLQEITAYSAARATGREGG
jgi:1,2-diacylglycerol 3-alpha-glucosyltransferase